MMMGGIGLRAEGLALKQSEHEGKKAKREL
jgi:hypothetical protein